MNTRPFLDLTRYHFMRPIFGKGITVYGTWATPAAGQYWPCLVLVPTHRQHTHQKVKPCVIPVADAYLWNPDTTDPQIEHYFTQAASAFADSLGLDGTNSHDVSTVINIVHDELSSLIQMPSLPPNEVEVVADAFQTDQDGKTKHAIITDRG